jgi:hypothetical protein
MILFAYIYDYLRLLMNLLAAEQRGIDYSRKRERPANGW